ncbi:Jag N-terminal domain-containing protein [Helicobacter sp. 11S02596-1]|uniref:Jag N-terminal domain-containing protein n=1 Tax=Helicobacter sp. 11S02596-1 TaxID=1476194 RepID=UPI000BA6A2A7|nr:Jag N-terminal domain-containing protein [Helicobacter sp. 11S02596-1]PAF44490.1 spoIIIJ-associated protein [Helicobacter sp. 11S02596-1]
MKKIVAKTLQEAITQASLELGCSVTELDYEIIQTPSKGFFGMGKKDAIIVATLLKTHPENPPLTASQTIQTPAPTIENEPKPSSQSSLQTHSLDIGNSSIDAVFFKDTPDPAKIAQEIQNELVALFAFMPYRIDKIEVSVYDSQTLLIILDGQDSALLIGEKGYRYKALSYLLFNWIHPKYGYNIRLEIAQFLKNQEEAMDVYLKNIITNVYETGKAQTKPLDGVLAYIALKKLREIFPNKYVSFRTNALNERYIIVSDFIRNE